MHRHRPILLLAGAFLLHGCGGRADAILPHEVLLPLQESPGHHAGDGPLVTARANDATWLFKVDTGADTCVLFNARDGHPWPLRRYWIPRAALGWGGMQRLTQYAVVDRLDLGETVLTNLRIPNVETEARTGLLGILGMDVLRRWAVLFDVDRSELRLLMPGDIGPRLSALYPGRPWTRLPLLGDPDRPEVALAAGQGGRIRFLVDTGVNETNVTPETARRLGLHPWEETRVTRDGQAVKATVTFTSAGVGGRFEARRYVLEGLHLGNRVCTPSVWQHALDDVLGYDHLGVTPFVVDSPGRALWIADLPEGCRSEPQVWAGRLTHPSKTLRDRAFGVLGDLDDLFPIPEVASLLDHPNPEMRAGAVELLRRWKARDLLPRIATLTRDPDPGVRRNAAQALGDDPAWTERLLDLLEDPDPNVREASLQALDVGARVDAARILQILEDRDARVRQAAGHMLGRLRDPAVLPGLLARLDSPDAGTRLAALMALGCYADKTLGPRFERLLGDPVPDIRAGAAEALERSGGDASLAGMLAPLLEDPDPNVQMHAAKALWSLLGKPWEIPGYVVLKQGPDGVTRFAKTEARYMEPARSWWRQHKDDPAHATGKSP